MLLFLTHHVPGRWRDDAKVFLLAFHIRLQSYFICDRGWQGHGQKRWRKGDDVLLGCYLSILLTGGRLAGHAALRIRRRLSLRASRPWPMHRVAELRGACACACGRKEPIATLVARQLCAVNEWLNSLRSNLRPRRNSLLERKQNSIQRDYCGWKQDRRKS